MNTSIENEGVRLVREALRQFRDVQNRLADFGASDTEPDWVMQNAVAVHLGLRKGRQTLPATADAWELYTASMDCSAAAAQLTDALRTLIETLGPLYLQSGEAKKEIRAALWRLDL